MQLLAGFGSSPVVGMGASFPYWLWASVSLVICHMSSSIEKFTSWQLASIGASKLREKAKARRTEADSLYNIISEVTSHHFYSICRRM